MFKAQIYMISLYSILLILFHRRMIFKMLVLEQSPEKSPFSAGEGGDLPTAPTSLGHGPGLSCPSRSGIETAQHIMILFLAQPTVAHIVFLQYVY